ncbi:MAG: cell wall hydrolase [Clostridia bacterium]|nr:cell wall hydrolase [Clostridia bacterium]
MKQLRTRLKRGAAALAAAAILSTAANAAPVIVDGKTMQMHTYIAGSRTHVPVRVIYEALGCEVNWDAARRQAVVHTPTGSVITVREGQYGLSDDNTYISADTSNRIRRGRLYAPIRAVAKSLDCTVDWNGTAALLKTPENVQLTPPESGTVQTPSYTESELYWLARIIYAEAGGESMEGMIAVGNTILNRVESELYPDTIYGVIFDRKYTVQYEPVLNGTIYNTPSADAYEAARRCLEGENVVGDCLFFLNPRKATNFWIVYNRSFYRSIGNHDFYL